VRLKFDSELDYQKEAMSSIVDIFEGQSVCSSNFTVVNSIDEAGTVGLFSTSLGVGNKLEIDEEDILKNVKKIQLRNGIAQSDKIKKGEYHFTIEMETGTGKTYVYLRTLLELNKKYGFTKFIIVVPTVAVKEGVVKSIDIMTDHFKLKYDNVIFKSYEYKSKNLDLLRDFATSDNIRIIVMTIQSFNKDNNVINNDNERTNGLKPLEFIQETHPIVIIDEPQSAAGTKKANDAIDSLNPLCTIGYSATHKEKYNLMYRLDAVDAYERQLVKQIEVASVMTKNYHNDAYLKLISVSNKGSSITGKIEIDKRKNGVIKRESVNVKKGQDLFEISGCREQYSGYIVSEIYTGKDSEYVDFSSKDFIKLGEVRGDLSDDIIKRAQIEKTIEEHLEKEMKLKQKGIKVLSLFFIDRVSNYRYYDEKGYPQKGKYALWFEEAYKRSIQKPKYKTLFEDVDIETEAEIVHNGYFAQDKKGVLKDTNGGTLADEDIYGLIMRDKERLLSFDSKLKFIFSHSALKEGWDNPNVFQICTLNETKSEMKKRQEIGRGLRLAVNQEGERIRGFNVNTLTVMANESYEDFAKSLQEEFEEDGNIKFGIIEKHTFANIEIEKGGKYKYWGQKPSEDIWNYFKGKGYIDGNGKVTNNLRRDIKDNKLYFPEEYMNTKVQVVEILRKIAGSLNIKNADDKKKISINKRRFLSPEFKELWDKVKYKTTYSVEVNSSDLIKVCSEEIMKNLKVEKAKLIYTKAHIEINVGGTKTEESTRYAMAVRDAGFHLPDIITYLQNETNLTRRSIVDILKKSKRLEDFKNNPQMFMDEVSSIIRRKMKYLLVGGVKYEKLGEDEFYAQELFEDQELYGYMSKNMMESDKSVYEYVVYDSGVEEEFARKFEYNNSVKVYAKLPSWFKIDTPLGSYNPDWAVLVGNNNEEKLYFVLETKGSILAEELRLREVSKIACGHKHFEALGTKVEFLETDNFNGFIEKL